MRRQPEDIQAAGIDRRPLTGKALLHRKAGSMPAFLIESK
jgi:hypothetical protein